MKLEEAFQALRKKTPRQVAEQAIKDMAESRRQEKEQRFTLGDMLSEETKQKMLDLCKGNGVGEVNGRFRKDRIIDKGHIHDSSERTFQVEGRRDHSR